MAKEDAIGMGPDGEIEQYPKGTSIPPTTFRVLDEDGTEQELTLDDDNDPFLEDDSDLELGDDDDDDEDVGSSSDEDD